MIEANPNDISRETFSKEDIDEFCSNLSDIVLESFIPLTRTMKTRGFLKYLDSARDAIVEAECSMREMNQEREEFSRWLPELLKNAEQLEELYSMLDAIEQDILPAVAQSVSYMSEAVEKIEQGSGSNSAGVHLTNFLDHIGLWSSKKITNSTLQALPDIYSTEALFECLCEIEQKRKQQTGNDSSNVMQPNEKPDIL
mmetsp:Transcript_30102/g.38842  ORF Transcript_30102/g.38842 Transcript_30102/m.38842 type:complete len:198 (+) Transcript_30102:67-660(+)